MMASTRPVTVKCVLGEVVAAACEVGRSPDQQADKRTCHGGAGLFRPAAGVGSAESEHHRFVVEHTEYTCNDCDGEHPPGLDQSWVGQRGHVELILRLHHQVGGSEPGRGRHQGGDRGARVEALDELFEDEHTAGDGRIECGGKPGSGATGDQNAQVGLVASGESGDDDGRGPTHLNRGTLAAEGQSGADGQQATDVLDG